jgi:hypothetical protein
MHISGIGAPKLQEIKVAALRGDLTQKSRKERSDAGSGFLEPFRDAMDGLINKVGESMPHITTCKPGATGTVFVLQFADRFS